MSECVSIVCVSYARKALLERCLQSCIDQDYSNLEILVVVNPANDGTEEMLLQRFPQAKTIILHKNIGFFPALNIAIANAQGKYVMTVDDDAYFLQNDAISRLTDYMQNHSEVGAASVNIEGPFEHTMDRGVREINVFKTGFAMLEKKVFTTDIGFYPDAFFRSAGENYICKKLWDSGKQVVQIADIRMFHDQAQAGRSDADWKFYGIRSQVLCSIMRDPLIILPGIVASKFIRSFFLFVKWNHAWTWVKAWASITVHLAYSLSLRDPIRLKTWKKLRRMEIS
jgi:GT2 family glycosyltransferase